MRRYGLIRCALPVLGRALGYGVPGYALMGYAMVGYAMMGYGGVTLAQPVDYGALEQLFGEPVTTSVTGEPQRVTDAPANIEIITQDDIRRSGATSIPEVLQFVTGLDVRRNGFASADVGIRGYNQTANPHLMVLVNGRQVYMPDYGRILWATIPVQLAEIRQIEVIKGPNSALYGFNAVDGVINIITYDPLNDHLNTATVAVGTENYLSGSAVGTGQIGKDAGVRLSLGGFQASDFPAGPLAPADAKARQSPFNGTFGADGRWQINPSVSAFAEASIGDTRLSEQSPPSLYDTETVVSTSVRAGVSADTPLGLISLSAYRSDASIDIGNISFTSVPVERDEYQTSYALQASDVVKLGTDHTLRFGLDYRDDALDSGPLALGTISDAIYSASLMWDWQIAPALSLTNAVRVDHLQLHYSGTLVPHTGVTVAQYDATTVTEPSFNSGVVWKVTDADTLRLTAARGVQLPTLLQYGLQIPPGVYGRAAYAGQPGLAPSVIWNAELDYDRALPAIASTLRTALFAQRIDDIIGLPFGATLTVVPPNHQVFFAQNVGYSTAAGLEIGIKGHSESGFRWNASYALATTTDHTTLNDGPSPTSIVEYAHSAPNHVVIGGIGYSRDRWELDVMGRWQSSYLDYRLNPTRTVLLAENVDNYVTMNARVGYRVTENVTVALTAQQFNAPALAETAGPPVQRQVILSLTGHL
jgi:iron complex outermembrane receptor protein